jgi:hypothetical protein
MIIRGHAVKTKVDENFEAAEGGTDVSGMGAVVQLQQAGSTLAANFRQRFRHGMA